MAKIYRCGIRILSWRAWLGRLGTAGVGIRATWLVSVTLLAIGLVGLSTRPAEAQLFGNRSLGRPLSRRPGPGTLPGTGGQESVGQVQGSERFLRGNRGQRSFVGADRQDSPGFVGLEQGRTGGAVLSSTAGIRPDVDEGARLNRPLSRPGPQEMYLPVLEIRFELPELAQQGQQGQQQRLQAELQRISRPEPAPGLSAPLPLTGAALEVSVAGTTATLQGVVASVADRDLAELVVLFEPGIERVINQLQVAPANARPAQ